MDSYLGRTPALDIDSPAIVKQVSRLVQGMDDEVERAVRIHDFVRDEIEFGWSPEFDMQTASQTLAAGIGFCNTKTPLFVAMLRAAGIPARLHFVGIHKAILEGLIDPIDRFVDHSYSEVFLNGGWLGVDSYIVDAPLYRNAMAKLVESKKVVGFGLHLHGTSVWTGETDSFAQFVNDGTSPKFSDNDFGIHEDVQAFYSSGIARTPRNYLFRRFILPGLLFFGNRRIRALRHKLP